MALTMYYATIISGGLLGIIMQSLIKINTINNRMETATFKSVLLAYLKRDFLNMSISLLTVIIYAYVSSEYLYIDIDSKKDFFEKFGVIGDMVGYYQSFFKTVSVGVGYCANSIIMATLGRTERWLKTQE